MRAFSNLIWGIVLALVGVFSEAQAAGYPFDESFDSSLSAWTMTGQWTTTTSRAHSSPGCLTDSPDTLYANSADSWAVVSSGINLSGATHPALRFYHQYELENSYDFGIVQVSTNSGGAWQTLSSYTASQPVWTREQLDLSSYAGSSSLLIRYRLTTDASVAMDGWYIDDVRVSEAPAAPVLNVVTNQGPNAMTLTWMASVTPGIMEYRVYRSRTPGGAWNTAWLVATTTPATTNFTDITVVPKTTYYYRVLAVDSNEVHAASNESGAATPAGMDFPFLDNGESGPAAWAAEGTWALSSEDAYSPASAWSDSPGGSYSNGINYSLRLAAPVNLTSSRSPVLSFNHRYAFLAGDLCSSEISTNGGQDWTALAQYTGTATTNWMRQRLSLAAYTNAAAALFRFRVSSDPSGAADGWHVDDISVSEPPDVINAPVVTELASHSLRLTWVPCTNNLFSGYALFRSTTPGVSINSTLVTTLVNRATTTFVDTGLALDTVYYYRVYAVNPYGAFSADGTEISVRTLNHPLPFADGFEGGLNGWNLTGTWGLTTESSHGGSGCLTDSPLTSYGNSQGTYALTAVDLTGKQWPVLKFWDKHSLAVIGGDRGRVEVSSDGGTWTWVYGVIQARTNWAEQVIDLSPWRGQPNVRIRFWLETDGSTLDDGWYIDDVSVAENANGPLAYPLVDGFENGLSNWLHAAWVPDTNGVYAGQGMVHDKDTDLSPYSVNHWLATGGALCLTSSVSPQVTFWAKGANDSSGFYVHVSGDGGVNWVDLGGNLVLPASWKRYQFEIPPAYRTANFRLRFQTTVCSWADVHENFYLDNVVIEDLPAAVSLLTPVPHLKSVDLSWTVSTLGSAFRRYAVYRATHATVTTADTLVGTFTDTNNTSMTDAGLSIGQPYYYKVFVVDTNDTYSGSNEGQTTTVPITLPLLDNLDTLSNWDVTGTWGITTETSHGGSGCLTDSPLTSYGNSQGTYALTAVNLTGKQWPVLKFWDKHSLAVIGGDRGRVEVSSDGGTWTWVYGVIQARTNWAEQVIDLSPWKGQPNVRIRFWLETDGSTLDDGWYIDDVSVAENSSGPLAYPLMDGFENGLSNWLHAAWVPDTNGVYAGQGMVHDKDTDLSPYSVNHWLATGGALCLTSSVSPQVTFWAKGANDSSGFYVHVSKDGGANWVDISGNLVLPASWRRYQFAIPADYRVADFRLKFVTIVCSWADVHENFYLDNVAIEDLPAAVSLLTPVPHLKSVDLSWTTSTLGSAFRRYAVYRATHVTVTTADTLVGTFTDTNSTSMTDTGLSIGQPYYYKVFVVDTNDTYSGSNEGQTTTVPITLPLSDALESLSNWDVTGTWGITTETSHGGSGCLADSPLTSYGNSQGTYALTAVNLTGKQWPVLKFWDKHSLAVIGGDRGRVEVSSDGGTWTWVYGVIQARTNWAEQVIDLSPWRGQPNVRIRFWLETDGSTLDDGWYIDDVSVAENANGPLAYPFVEGFENGLSNWLHAAWVPDTNGVYAGQGMVHDKDTDLSPYSVNHWLATGGALCLTSSVSPQVTFWAKGANDSSGFYVHASGDGGMNWVDLGGNLVLPASWKRYQFEIPPAYRTANFRLRFQTTVCSWADVHENFYLDNVVIEDLPVPVSLWAPVPRFKTVDLQWNTSALGVVFRRYDVYRATHATVTVADTRVGSFTNASMTNMTDGGLAVGATYYYKVFVVDTNETYSGSNEGQATTLVAPFPLSDSLETPTNWDFTGVWGLTTETSHSGTKCLADSPYATYSNSASSSAQTSVDLRGTQWPVLRFWDRYNLAMVGGDRGRVEISSDGGTWTWVYGVMQARTNWQEQVIDLSPWKGQANVRIRFWIETDGSSTDDGWYIDDVSVMENPRVAAYPFYDGFENGVSNWLHAAWIVDTNDAYTGQGMAHDKSTEWSPYAVNHWLAPAGTLNLTSSVNPQLTFWAKGNNDSSGFYVHISKDGGVTWFDMTGNMVLLGTWRKFQYVIPADYRVADLRVRFVTSVCSWSDVHENFTLDNIGLGEPAPGVPSLYAPALMSTVNVRRPTLTVINATDYQSDQLTYRFEVSSDSQFSNTVAQVPAIASGIGATSWTVDADLPNVAQYWWRCRAEDGINTGLWMAAATFFVNMTNTPPDTVLLATPPPGSILPDLSSAVGWYPAMDPDIGDAVIAYQVQIAADPSFTNLVVNDSQVPFEGSPSGTNWVNVIPLSSLAGVTGLATNRTYFWRARAEDTWHDYSGWSTGVYWFVFGTPPPNINGFKATAGSLSFEWDRTGKAVYIDFSPSLSPAAWAEAAGPLYGTNWTVQPSSSYSQGFYRVRTE